MTKDTSRRGFFAWLTTAIAGVAFGGVAKSKAAIQDEAAAEIAPTQYELHKACARERNRGMARSGREIGPPHPLNEYQLASADRMRKRNRELEARGPGPDGGPLYLPSEVCGICEFPLYAQADPTLCDSCETRLCQGCAVPTQDGVRTYDGWKPPRHQWTWRFFKHHAMVCPKCWPKYQDPKVKYRSYEPPPISQEDRDKFLSGRIIFD